NVAGAEPATERLTTPTAPPPRTGPLTQSSVSTTARTSALPPDFHTIFAETEYMLWGHDDSGNPGTPASYQERQRTDTFAHSAVVVPPVLREQGGTFDDTESRVAMNWINWLQALGARPLDGRPARLGTGPLTGPVASSAPPWPGHTGPLVLPPIQTGPLPPPTPEALRRMFAELEPEGISRRVVDGNIVEAEDEASDAPGDINDEERETARSWSDSQASVAGWTLDSGLPAEMRRLRDLESEPAAITGEAAHEAERNAADDSAGLAVATLESLEQGFTASGFSNVELRPGELAALSGQPVAREADGHAPSVFSGPLVGNGAVHSAPATPPEPESASVDDEPEPGDYAGRLDRARGRRANGQLEDALGEYRLILKNAPDLLAEIVSELQESMMAAPENPEVHRLLGDARIREGDYLSALES
ncbi:MAG: hypothetical protein ACRDHE_16150, partial [Ktedonobacterales bacterium]